jgi:hypothetical protein
MIERLKQLIVNYSAAYRATDNNAAYLQVPVHIDDLKEIVKMLENKK